MLSAVPSNRERHLRAICYVLVSLCLALVGYVFMGFDRAQTLGYAVAAYVILNAVNFRAMFGGQKPGDEPPRRNSSPG